jgi:hypothetical protein
VADFNQSVNNLACTVLANAERLGYFGVGHKARFAIFRKAGNLGQQNTIHRRQIKLPYR